MTSKTYVLVDSLNTYFRSIHTAHRASDTWAKMGLALHVTLASVNAVVRRHPGAHVVFATEGKSWRKAFYPPYKKNREVARQAQTQAEKEESEMLLSAYSSLIEFLREKTNTSVLHHPEAEADDLIARFIALHPEDEIIIVSSDTDYYQLVNEHVSIYNGVADEHITINGIFNAAGKPVKDRNTKEQKMLGDPQWLLFEKCMRGDKTDNVFSAYPGVRVKGTKNKVGLMEAFEDRVKKGYAWNNLMLQKWADHNDQEHRVLDDYNRNVTLIDLTAQPADIKAKVDRAITEQLRAEAVHGQVGLHFLKFCGKFELKRLSDDSTAFAQWLNQPYAGVLK